MANLSVSLEVTYTSFDGTEIRTSETVEYFAGNRGETISDYVTRMSADLAERSAKLFRSGVVEARPETA